MADITLNDNALVTLEDVREALMLEDTETANDNFLTNKINRMSTRIESYCRRKFKAAFYTEVQDGDSERGDILVDNPPIIWVSGLWDDSDALYTSDSLIESGDYVLEKEEGAIRLTGIDSAFSSGIQNVKVAYSGGYNEVPLDIQDACVEWVVFSYRKYQSKTFGFTSKSAPGGNIGVDMDSMPAYVKETLNSYRIVRV